MSDSTRALVLHVAGVAEPLIFALSDKDAKSLAGRVGPLLNSGAVDSLELADGGSVAINFGHVVSAHLDELPSHSVVYGSLRRHGRGFSG